MSRLLGIAPILRAGTKVPSCRGARGPVAAARQSEKSPGPNALSLNIDVRDRDGYINAVTVKWGDGMQDIKRYPLVDCVDEKPGWPRPKWAAFTLQHAYGNSGNYEVEVIVSSSGCDGGHAQSATETITVTAA